MKQYTGISSRKTESSNLTLVNVINELKGCSVVKMYHKILSSLSLSVYLSATELDEDDGVK